ncbi:MAG: helix-turn-helix transcriptional regulator [Saprospiraceae bacterium]|nr:helix-turn-helix transcriptional regulator [Saprospiraceae bacterium]
MKNLDLIIERGKNKMIWGRVTYKSNLVVESSKTIPGLENKIKKLLLDFHGIKEINFNHLYDLRAFFDRFDSLNQSKLAHLASINPSLLRQYASGTKFPSIQQASKIEKAIHKLAEELSKVSIYA